MSAAVKLPELDEQVRIRPATDDDARFVINSWLTSYRKGERASKWAASIPGPVYYPSQRAIVERCLVRGQTIVASHVEDPGQILGWALMERTKASPILHYVYVKQVFRKLGIASALLDAFNLRGGFCSHMTEGGRALAKGRRLLFNPYLAGVVP